MAKQKYNKETESGWIDGQFCHISGNYIERLDFSTNLFEIYFNANNVNITLKESQLREIIEMLKIFEKEELKKRTSKERKR